MRECLLIDFGFSTLKDVAFLIVSICRVFLSRISFLIVNVFRVFLSMFVVIPVNLEFWVFLSSFSHRLSWCHLSLLIVLSSEIFWVFLFTISRLFSLSLESLVMFIVCLSRPLGLI